MSSTEANTLNSRLPLRHQSPRQVLGSSHTGLSSSGLEITAQFGIDCWARIPWDPKPAGVLSHGLTPPRRFNNSPLLGSYRVAALHLTQRLERARALRRELLQGGAP